MNKDSNLYVTFNSIGIIVAFFVVRFLNSIPLGLATLALVIISECIYIYKLTKIYNNDLVVFNTNNCELIFNYLKSSYTWKLVVEHFSIKKISVNQLSLLKKISDNFQELNIITCMIKPVIIAIIILHSGFAFKWILLSYVLLLSLILYASKIVNNLTYGFKLFFIEDKYK